ncbi:MAG: hypothetical protein Fur003_3470 [Candidatus Dojkabacteria bacterium]
MATFLYLEKRQRTETAGQYSKRATRIIEELQKAGHEYKIGYLDQVGIMLDAKGMRITVDDEDIRDFTKIIFGGHSNGDPEEYRLKTTIAKYIAEHNKTAKPTIKIQNHQFMLNFPNYTKIAMAELCIKAGLPHLPTFYHKDGNYKKYAHLVGGYPLICKINSGENEKLVVDGKTQFKKNVFLIESEADWDQDRLKEYNLGDFLIQKFTPIAEDYRIFIAKGKVIGGWKRVSTDDGFMTVSGERKYLLYNSPSKEILEICNKALKVWDFDFMALDFIYLDGKPFILEFSLHPGFNAYENKCLKGMDAASQAPVNVAKAVVESL